MQSITLQTNDTIVVSGDILGRVQFAASAESDGGASRLAGPGILGMAEGSYGASSNPASLVFATSAADGNAATNRIKISHEGNIVPIGGSYDIGQPNGYGFNNLYVSGITVDQNLFFVDGSADKIGISTNTPASLFHIRKDSTYNSENTHAIKISDGNDPETHGMLLGVDSTNDIVSIQGVDPGTSWNRNLSLQAMGGSVGIGTIDPGVYKLRVVGGHSSFEGGNVQFDGGNVTINQAGGNYDFRAEGGSDENLLFVDASTDRVGIGTATPAFKLDVEGDAEINKIQIGSQAYSAGSHTQGITHVDYDDDQSYMIMSDGDNTYTSCHNLGGFNYMRGPQNSSTYQVVVGNSYMFIGTDTTERMTVGSTETVFNQDANNYDFRVEGDTDANLLFLDASKDSVLIGNGSDGGVNSKLHVYEVGNFNTTYSRTVNIFGRAYSTTDGTYYHTGLNSRAEKYLSASTTDGGYCIGVNAAPVIYSPDGTNTLAELSAFRCNPSINSAASNVTITNAYDIKTIPYFQGTNNTITNHYGLYLGNAGLGGTTPTNEYGVYQDNTNATNRFTGATAFGSYAPRGGYAVTSYGFMSVEAAEGKMVVIDGPVASKIQASTNNNAGVIGTESAHPLHLYAGNSAKAVLTTNGKFGVGGAHDPTTYLDIDGDKMRVRDALTPASASASGSQGDICWDSNYVYVCVATDTWKRSALSTW